MVNWLRPSVIAKTTGSSCISPRCAFTHMRLIQYSRTGTVSQTTAWCGYSRPMDSPLM